MKMTPLPRLRTTRLSLEPFSEDDIVVLHDLWTLPEVRRYLWDDLVISRDQAARTVHAAMDSVVTSGIGMWTLRLINDLASVIGFCGLRPLPCSEDVELLYGLEPRLWKLGLATEASIAVLRYAFVDLKLVRVFAGADPPNIPSFAVMKRLGMSQVEEGIASVPHAIYYVVAAAAFLEKIGDAS